MADVMIDILNACAPADGICTGGRPRADQLKQAQERGIRRVINLCTPDEMMGFNEAKIVAGLGMDYVNIPVRGAVDLTPENARALAAALPTDGSGVLVHCASGNRVGALFALKAHFVDGLDPEAAVEAGIEAGLKSLEPAVREILSAPG